MPEQHKLAIPQIHLCPKTGPESWKELQTYPELEIYVSALCCFRGDGRHSINKNLTLLLDRAHQGVPSFLDNGQL